jgi:iron complex outermembrane receptor protein
VYVSSDRNYSYVGIRGFLRPGDFNTKVLLLVDGHPMNDGVYDSAYYGHEGVVDVDMIDRVEVIRGPSSSIYGSSAFFGVINVITRQGAQVNGGEVSAAAGSYDTYSGRFTVGRKLNDDLQFLLSGTVYYSEGVDHLYYPEFDPRISSDPRAANNGVADGLDGERAFGLNGSLQWRDFSLSAFYTDRDKDIPTASYETVFNDGRESTSDRMGFVDLKCDHEFENDSRLMGRLGFDFYRYSGVWPYDYAEAGDPPDLVLVKDHTIADRVTAELQYTARLWDRHRLILGAAYRENLRQFQDSYDDVTPRYYWSLDDRTTRDLGLYTEAEIGLLTNLVLNAGARYDYFFESFGGTWNPRIGLIYNPWEGGAFKALYGQAFRSPSVFEQYYYKDAPALEPETIQTYELVYEQYLRKHYGFSLGGYYYEVDNLITEQDASEPGEVYFSNLEQARAWGAEFEVSAKYDGGLSARASYAFQQAEDTTTGEHLSASPQHLAKLNASYPLYRDKVFAGLELQYTSRMRTLAGNNADDFPLANVTLFGQRLWKGLEVSASVYNLFAVRYGYPGAVEHLQDVITQDGRSFRLKLTYRF